MRFGQYNEKGLELGPYTFNDFEEFAHAIHDVDCRFYPDRPSRRIGRFKSTPHLERDLGLHGLDRRARAASPALLVGGN